MADKVEYSLTLMPDLPLAPKIKLLGVRIEVLSGPDASKKKTFRKQSVIIGSGKDNDFVINDPTLSRNHLQIDLETDGATIIDLESKNGTYLGETRIYRAMLKGTATLRLGNSTILFETTTNGTEVNLTKKPLFHNMIGISEKMRAIFSTVERISSSDLSVLIEGETGTGKELLAKAIHETSARAEKPYVVLDCSTISESIAERELFGHEKDSFIDARESSPGIFERADGGTLFIDEVGELSAAIQSSLLRVIETGEFRRLGSTTVRKLDIRFIFATNSNLRIMVNEGLFRRDLYYRINSLQIELPPLRNRKKDILPLAQNFLRKISIKDGAQLEDVEVQNMLKPINDYILHYKWPGNIRELKNRMEKFYFKYRHAKKPEVSLSLTLTDTLQETMHLFVTDLIPQQAQFKAAKQQCIRLFEETFLVELLRQCNHNISETSRRCGMDRRNLQKLLNKYGI